MKRKILALILALVMSTILISCADEGTNIGVEGSASTNTAANEVAEESTDTVAEEHIHGGYEWIGEYELTVGEYFLNFGASPDVTMDVGFVKLGENVTDLEHHALHLMSVKDKEVIEQGGTIEVRPDYVYTINMDPEQGRVNFKIAEAGTYAF